MRALHVFAGAGLIAALGIHRSAVGSCRGWIVRVCRRHHGVEFPWWAVVTCAWCTADPCRDAWMVCCDGLMSGAMSIPSEVILLHQNKTFRQGFPNRRASFQGKDGQTPWSMRLVLKQ